MRSVLLGMCISMSAAWSSCSLTVMSPTASHMTLLLRTNVLCLFGIPSVPKSLQLHSRMGCDRLLDSSHKAYTVPCSSQMCVCPVDHVITMNAVTCIFGQNALTAHMPNNPVKQTC